MKTKKNCQDSSSVRARDFITENIRSLRNRVYYNKDTEKKKLILQNMKSLE